MLESQLLFEKVKHCETFHLWVVERLSLIFFLVHSLTCVGLTQWQSLGFADNVYKKGDMICDIFFTGLGQNDFELLI